MDYFIANLDIIYKLLPCRSSNNQENTRNNLYIRLL